MDTATLAEYFSGLQTRIVEKQRLAAQVRRGLVRLLHGFGKVRIGGRDVKCTLRTANLQPAGIHRRFLLLECLERFLCRTLLLNLAFNLPAGIQLRARGSLIRGKRGSRCS